MAAGDAGVEEAWGAGEALHAEPIHQEVVDAEFEEPPEGHGG
jgi:hypothetical protein